MPDQFSETATTGYGSRIVNSFKGIFAGLVLFIAAIVLLYWNEGRFDYSILARQAVEVNADKGADSGAQSKLVAATGFTSATQPLGDKFVPNASTTDQVILKDSKYFALYRKVEMYSWKEDKTTRSTKNTGGSETTETSYNYRKDWTENPTKSSEFKYPENHLNPAMMVQPVNVVANDGKVGLFTIDANTIQLPRGQAMDLTTDKVVIASTTKGVGVVGTYIFTGKGSFNAPEIGDLRISYEVVPVGAKVTVFGKLEGTALSTYVDTKNHSLYRMTMGSKDEGVRLMHKEYTTLTWILRLLGFLGVWIGLSLFFGPISTLLDVLPFLGSVSRGLIGLVTFVVALALSLAVIIVSMILHSIIAVIIAIVAVGIGAVVIMKRVRQKKLAAATV